MLQLPSHPSPICLRGFLLSVGFTFLMLAAVLSALLPLAMILTFTVATLILILTCLARPQLGLISYKVWNRLTRYFGGFARMYSMAVCYFLIISPVGRICSSLRIRPPQSSESMWVPRSSVDPSAYRSLYGAVGKGEWTDSSWRSFVSWGLRTDNLWACTLVPLINLLSLLENEQEVEVSSDIYTLF